MRALASLFFHYLHVESNTDAADGSADERSGLSPLQRRLRSHGELFPRDDAGDAPAIYAALLEEQRCTSAVGFLSPAHTQLFTLSQRIIDAGGRAQKKQENLRQLLATDFKDNFAHEPLLPVRFDLPAVARARVDGEGLPERDDAVRAGVRGGGEFARGAAS